MTPKEIMKRKSFYLFAGVLSILVLVVFVKYAAAEDLTTRLRGRILLQVQARGEAWYVNPVNLKRYYLRDGGTAYQLMRTLGLGITNANLAKIPVVGSSQQGDRALIRRLSGRILLQVQSRGEAWYVNPVNGKRYYLADGNAAYQLMRQLGLGIRDSDLAAIPVFAVVPPPITPLTCGYCQYRANNQCVPYTCCADNDCADSSMETQDVCVNPGNAGAYCEHHQATAQCGSCQYRANNQCVPYTCCADNDCADSSMETQDVCVNPGNAGAYCEHHQATAQCGSCQYLSNNQCVNYACCADSQCNDGNDATVDSCLNAGTVASSCQHQAQSVPGSHCQELVPGHNSLSGNRVNIVLVGINFDSMGAFRSVVDTWATPDNPQDRDLFYHEPFRSNSSKINLWYVDEIGQVENFTEGQSDSWTYASNEFERLQQLCNVPNRQKVALVNWNFRSTAHNGAYVSMYGTEISDDNLVDSFVHELGHSFGLLADEYVAVGNGRPLITANTVDPEYPNYTRGNNADVATAQTACPRWCSGSPLPMATLRSHVCAEENSTQCKNSGDQCVWLGTESINGFTGCANSVQICDSFSNEVSCSSAYSFQTAYACSWIGGNDPSYSYYGTSCISNNLGDINVGTSCLANSGCYQGATYINRFRSTRASMMGFAGYRYTHEETDTFNVVSQRQLCRRIRELTGSAGGICPSLGIQ